MRRLPPAGRSRNRVLDEHDAAIGAFRRSVPGLRPGDGRAWPTTMAGIRRANEAQGKAIEAMMAANREALALLNNDASEATD